MNGDKLHLKIFDKGMFVNSIDFKLYDTPLFAHDKVEEEIERLRGEILRHFKGKPIHASMFTEDMKTDFSYSDIGQLMVHHLGKVTVFFSEYYQYVKVFSQIRLFVIAVSNKENHAIQNLTLSAAFPPGLMLWKPEDLPRKPRLTIYDRIPGPIHSLVESSFLRLLKFKEEEERTSFLDDFHSREKEIRQLYKRQFHSWEKDGSVVTAGPLVLDKGKDAHFPICMEISDAEGEKLFTVACNFSAENIPDSIEEELTVSFVLSS